MDILLNKNFEVELDDRNDLATVEGRRAVEQSIALMVNSYFYEEIGSASAVNAVENIELQAKKVVAENQYVDGIQRVTARRTSAGDGTAGGIEVSLLYDTGDLSKFEVGN